MRVTNTGDWLDTQLATTLLNAMVNPPEHPLNRMPKVKLSDMFLCLIAMIMLSKPEESVVLATLSQFHVFLAQKSADPSIARLFLYIGGRVAQKSLHLGDLFNLFLTRGPKFASLVRSLIPIGVVIDFMDGSFLHRTASEFGFDFALLLETLGSFCQSLSELERSRAANASQFLAKVFQAFDASLPDLDYAARLSDAIKAFDEKQRHDRRVSAKVFRRFTRSLTADGGPWSDHVVAGHWRLAPRTDALFRHLFLRPNRNFDIHRLASLHRKESKNDEEGHEYERWIEPQQKQVDEFQSEELGVESTELESKLRLQATLITIAAVYEGTFSLSNSELCFDGVKVTESQKMAVERTSTKTIHVSLRALLYVLHRSYLHIDKGLEFFMRDGRSYFLFFANGERNSILAFLRKLDLPNKPTLQLMNSMKFVSDLRLTEKWLERKISTYEYLILLNLAAGRSFNDLSQYPVFPWVIADYESPILDLENPRSFRDFTKPVGALNEQQLKKLKQEFAECPDPIAPCLYRGHYSTAFFVLHYLIRMEPFTTMHITMQAGKFDHPNRLFTSVPRAWSLVTSTIHDYRELIPEFFSFPDFLLNPDNFDLGLPESESNVELPKWASSPMDFITKNRGALECAYVDHNLPDWIDLIFGVKQNGKAAMEAHNVFHPYSYAMSVTKQAQNNPDLLADIQNHAVSFGITPRQLFTTGHPRRSPAPVPSNRIQFQPYYAARCEILLVEMWKGLFYLMTADGVISRIKKKLLDHKWCLPAGFGIGNRVLFFPSCSTIVMNSPSGDSFHTFRMDSTLIPVNSFRHQFSALTSLAKGDTKVLVVQSHDCSMNVWNVQKNERLYQVTYHSASAVDAAVSESLRLIASCDSRRRVVFIQLWNGAFIRSFDLADEKQTPVKIMLIDDGYCAAVTEARFRNEVKSVIQIYGMNTTLLGSYLHETAVTCWCPICRVGKQALIAVAFENCDLVILLAPVAKAETKATFSAPIRTMSFDAERNTLYLADSEYRVFRAVVDC
jgi:hypothetical protein